VKRLRVEKKSLVDQLAHPPGTLLEVWIRPWREELDKIDIATASDTAVFELERLLAKMRFYRDPLYMSRLPWRVGSQVRRASPTDSESDYVDSLIAAPETLLRTRRQYETDYPSQRQRPD
jgi:hypothetical protein